MKSDMTTLQAPLDDTAKEEQVENDQDITELKIKKKLKKRFKKKKATP